MDLFATYACYNRGIGVRLSSSPGVVVYKKNVTCKERGNETECKSVCDLMEWIMRLDTRSYRKREKLISFLKKSMRMENGNASK